MSTITPKTRSLLTKLATVARTNTTAKELFGLPKSAIIAGLYIIGPAVSDAGTTATMNVGSTTTATEYLSAFDVKGTTGEGYHPAGAAAVGSAFATPVTSDIVVYGKYAETGIASTTGGPWTIKLEYYVSGPGEVL